MVVDDDETIRGLVDLALSGKGYAVTEAADGAVALALVGKVQPDVILLDMRMPVLDGWAFAQAYQQIPGPRAPIVVVTAAHDAAERAAQIHADAYLSKPFDLDDLYACVEQWTSLQAEPEGAGLLEAQCAMLERLLELTVEQGLALERRDIHALNALSQARADLVHAAASYVPPQRPWEPELADLATFVQHQCLRLQRNIQACQVALQGNGG